MSNLHSGWRFIKLKMNGNANEIPEGGAVSSNLDRRLTNAATRYAGKCLKRELQKSALKLTVPFRQILLCQLNMNSKKYKENYKISIQLNRNFKMIRTSPCFFWLLYRIDNVIFHINNYNGTYCTLWE